MCQSCQSCIYFVSLLSALLGLCQLQYKYDNIRLGDLRILGDLSSVGFLELPMQPFFECSGSSAPK